MSSEWFLGEHNGNIDQAEACDWRRILARERLLDLSADAGLAPRGPDNALIEPVDVVGGCRGDIECRERFGGMLRYYFRTEA